MECSRGSFCYSGMARRRCSDGAAAHTNTADGGAAGLEALRARGLDGDTATESLPTLILWVAAGGIGELVGY